MGQARRRTLAGIYPIPTPPPKDPQQLARMQPAAIKETTTMRTYDGRAIRGIEKQIVLTAIARLKASGDFDRDAFLQFLDEFYQYLANEGHIFKEPVPVTAEWIGSIADAFIDFFATWHRAESESGRQFLRDHPPRDDDDSWGAWRILIAELIDSGMLSYDEKTRLLRSLGQN
jgi:hypothetical protein